VSEEEPAGKAAFPYLGPEALRAFALLGTPVYIYSFVTERICWSNPPACAFWDAASAAELHARELGPYSTATAVRLAEYREEFGRGGDRLENWTFYPRGKATSALCRCSGVRLDGHAEAMLVEVHSLRRIEMPVSELRALEALRHTPLMITLFGQTGEVLMRNPAASAAFGGLDRSLEPGADHLRAMFAQASDHERLLRAAGPGQQGGAGQQQLAAGEGGHGGGLRARRGRHAGSAAPGPHRGLPGAGRRRLRA